MDKRTELVSKNEVLNYIHHNFAENYPIESCDTWTRTTGYLVRNIMLGILQDVKTKAFMEEGE